MNTCTTCDGRGKVRRDGIRDVRLIGCPDCSGTVGVGRDPPKAATVLLGLLADALAWYYADIYDGPETSDPEWVTEGRETLGELLAPSSDLRTRSEAVDARIYKDRRISEGGSLPVWGAERRRQDK